MPNEQRPVYLLDQAIYIPVKEEAGRFKLMESGSRVAFLDTVTDSPVHEKKSRVRLREELGSCRLFLESLDERKKREIRV